MGTFIRATLVDNAIADGSMYRSKGWEYAKEAWVHGGTLHFIGLLSDGGVHSRYNRLNTLQSPFETVARRIMWFHSIILMFHIPPIPHHGPDRPPGMTS